MDSTTAPEWIDEKAALAKLREYVKAAGAQDAAARALRISPQYLNDVLMKRRAMSERVCRGLGLTRHVVYIARPARSSS